MFGENTPFSRALIFHPYQFIFSENGWSQCHHGFQIPKWSKMTWMIWRHRPVFEPPYDSDIYCDIWDITTKLDWLLKLTMIRTRGHLLALYIMGNMDICVICDAIGIFTGIHMWIYLGHLLWCIEQTMIWGFSNPPTNCLTLRIAHFKRIKLSSNPWLWARLIGGVLSVAKSGFTSENAGLTWFNQTWGLNHPTWRFYEVLPSPICI